MTGLEKAILKLLELDQETARKALAEGLLWADALKAKEDEEVPQGLKDAYYNEENYL
jgi:hypothetical protein